MHTMPKPGLRPALLLSLLALAALLAGCGSTTVINEYREQPTVSEIKKNEAVVILGRRNRADHETEGDFIDCVGATHINR